MVLNGGNPTKPVAEVGRANAVAVKMKAVGENRCGVVLLRQNLVRRTSGTTDHGGDEHRRRIMDVTVRKSCGKHQIEGEGI
jgi:hypothetical protein